MQTWRPIGKNRYYIDNDCVFWEVREETTPADIHEIAEVTIAVYKQRGVVFFICDAFGAPQPSAATRGAMNARYQSGNTVPAPTVVVGGSALMRTLLSLVVRAIRLLGGNPPPIEFVATQEEARAWLQRQRHEHASKQGSATL